MAQTQKQIKAWRLKNREKLNQQKREAYRANPAVFKERARINRLNQEPFRFRCAVMVAGMRDRSRLFDIKFDKHILTTKYFMDKLTNNPYCECCKIRLDLNYKFDQKANEKSPSVDRVIPNLGYTIGNIAILCWRCNRIKQDATPVELRTIAEFMEKWYPEIFNNSIVIPNLTNGS